MLFSLLELVGSVLCGFAVDRPSALDSLSLFKKPWILSRFMNPITPIAPINNIINHFIAGKIVAVVHDFKK